MQIAVSVCAYILCICVDILYVLFASVVSSRIIHVEEESSILPEIRSVLNHLAVRASGPPGNGKSISNVDLVAWPDLHFKQYRITGFQEMWYFWSYNSTPLEQCWYCRLPLTAPTWGLGKLLVD